MYILITKIKLYKNINIKYESNKNQTPFYIFLLRI
jgi:hypothetical protein